MHKVTFHRESYLTYHTYSLWKGGRDDLLTGKNFIEPPAYDVNDDDAGEEAKENAQPVNTSGDDGNNQDSEARVVNVPNDDNQHIEDLIKYLGDVTMRRETIIIQSNSGVW